jgi:hypothetical protein
MNLDDIKNSILENNKLIIDKYISENYKDNLIKLSDIDNDVIKLLNNIENDVIKSNRNIIYDSK